MIKNFISKALKILRQIKNVLFDNTNEERLIISIVDDKYTRQFSVNHNIKKILILAFVLIIGIVLIWIFTTRFLLEDLERVALEKEKIQTNFTNMYRLNEKYTQDIQSKADELAEINDKISSLEFILDIQKNIDNDPNLKIDIKSINNENKKLILNIIPNGNSVETYTKKTAINKKQLSKNINAAFLYSSPTPMPVYATADGTIQSIHQDNSRNYGNYIKVIHSFGFTSMYGFMSDIKVKAGDFVSKGHLLGYASKREVNYETYYETRFLDLYLDINLYTSWSLNNFNIIENDQSGVNWDGLINTIYELIVLKKYRDNKIEQGI